MKNVHIQMYVEGGGGVYCFTSIRPSFHPSKIFFVEFFSATIDGRNLIFGHKLHIGTPYGGKRFWTRKFKLVFRAKYDRGLDFRLLGNIETFELNKYYKLFPDLVEKMH
jgi:hypothetical protein